MRLLICGDLAITKDVEPFFEGDNVFDLFDSDIQKKFFDDTYDLITANLETPLTNCDKNINKCGPSIKGTPSSCKGIKQLNVGLVTLANNHICDFGDEGIKETIKTLNNYNIKHIGSKIDGQFNNSMIVNISNVKVGFYSVCENEFSSCLIRHNSANSLDIPRCLDEIKKLKQECDYVIVLYHGGKELYKYPTPFEQKICRSFVDSGCDLVIVQHSHCIGCFEVYQSKTIVYGQGNFVFGRDPKQKEYRTSLLLDVEINNKKNSINYIPIEIANNKICISNNKAIIDDFIYRSNQISSPGFVDEEYSRQILNSKYYIYYALFHKSIAYQRIDKRIFKHALIKRYIKKHKSSLLQLYNLILCESHKEMIDAIFREDIL